MIIPIPVSLTMRIGLVLLLAFVARGAGAAERPSLASFIELPWPYVIGGHLDGRWRDSEAAGKHLIAKTSYRVFTLREEEGRVSAGKAAPEADVCPGVWMRRLIPTPDPSRRAIGVSAAWEPMPRKSKAMGAEDEGLIAAVRDLLASRGFTEPAVKITQALRVDLRGDGVAVELIAATHYAHAEELSPAELGDYSFVAVRAAGSGQAKLRLFTGEFYPRADPEAAPNIYDVAGLLDLDGDGALEVLIHTSCYEGGGIQVWQWRKDELQRVLALECGV